MVSDVTFLFICSAMASGAYGVCRMYTLEVYPTAIRNSAVGFSASISRWGDLAAPFLCVQEKDICQRERERDRERDREREREREGEREIGRRKQWTFLAFSL